MCEIQPNMRKAFIKGAINLPVDELRGKLHELPQGETIYVHCQVGLQGYIATRILRENGFEAVNLDGGYRTYEEVKGEE